MDKIGKPRGLIRYTTENALAQHFTKKDVLSHLARPRIVLYSVVLVLICLATAWSMATRVPLMVDVIRDRSTLSREADDGSIENVYNLKLMNTTESAQRYRLTVDGLAGIRLSEEAPIEVRSAENHEVTVVVQVPPESGKSGANPIYFNIQAESDAKIAVREKATFLKP
jgi:polyferredoxin